MPLPIKDLHTVEVFPGYVAEFNVDIPLRTATKTLPHDPLLVRDNVYRPKGESKHPVLVTESREKGHGVNRSSEDRFHPKSFAEVDQEQKSQHSTWETPDPGFWTSHGYVVLRVDERGCGQSPGMLDSMSRTTSDAFFDVVKWAAEQPWSTGKVGLLGISYYAGSQWRVAARRPKGLAAIVPWEGMSDYYRDRVRHGGILSNTFIDWWWNRQVVSNQYGLAGRAARNWGPDTLEGSLPESELREARRSQPADTAEFRFRDDEYYSTKDFDLADIEVPLLSVANWGGILLHLRGNVVGYMQAESKFKYLRCITGRHDLPFYYPEEVKVQKSFHDAFLKGEDDVGWSVPGRVPPVDICLRQPGLQQPSAERTSFPRRQESEWPISRTQYIRFYLAGPGEMTTEEAPERQLLKHEAMTGELNFHTKPFTEAVEITGHSLTSSPLFLDQDGFTPSDMDIFVTVRHYDVNGDESRTPLQPPDLYECPLPRLFYTGTTGEPVPVAKGWLRLSLRQVDTTDPRHRHYLPHQNYRSSDVLPVDAGVEYPVDVEIWPTNVVVAKGHTLGLQIAGHDTQGSGLFEHTHPEDRPKSVFDGLNRIHVGPGSQSYLELPIIPQLRNTPSDLSEGHKSL
ncbi:LOW QUALITY PROTEIN: X-Pro dipeptidyl-peptidase protein [Colletotrichum higginsianum IMI 349063]|uniref:X-Pro dipeptidyl-peptidase protein n=1 Tax=Colletotrichum higginsianum (strain IMI 349063) TaxID=759273 RepID=A0A1B7Y876_COLHI|nr:LOW QUALITY PROTEIN: X-Pro dipeptidyl-peptidase protein [Colletotrichum higginsianum IMI 349063]OBR08125.1 LOW QUALITY PROTEIN: X-Pro dipeptidyl-peptidase protein [Colletotrichum higginsianum IMI 349063]